MNFSTIYLRRFFLAIALLLGSIAAHATIALGEVVPASAGNCDGSIEVIANGTAGPFFIEIIGSDGFSDFVEGIGADDPAVGSYTFTGLCSGDYTIYVTNPLALGLRPALG